MLVTASTSACVMPAIKASKVLSTSCTVGSLLLPVRLPCVVLRAGFASDCGVPDCSSVAVEEFVVFVEVVDVRLRVVPDELEFCAKAVTVSAQMSATMIDNLLSIN